MESSADPIHAEGQVDNVQQPSERQGQPAGADAQARPSSLTHEDLLRCAHGELFGPGNPQLPLPPMLMLDRVSHIADKGGKYDRGELIAELDIHPEMWFFACHFEGDPVMPGCLGLDALWQLVGFHLGWLGGLGRGRALGVGDVRFTGQITPQARLVTYHVHIKRIIQRKLTMGIADGEVAVDGEVIYQAQDLRVGLFTSTNGF